MGTASRTLRYKGICTIICNLQCDSFMTLFTVAGRNDGMSGQHTVCLQCSFILHLLRGNNNSMCHYKDNIRSFICTYMFVFITCRHIR